LINLIGNAIKFTHHGKVQVRLRFDPERWQLHFEVVDTGIGISPEQMKRIFSPFSQGDVSVSRNFGGTGLGLVISQRLAEMLGGTLTAKSIEGTGSTFSFSITTGNDEALKLVDYNSLPFEAQMQLSSRQIVTIPGESIRLSCRVLVVDDRRDIRYLSRYILTKAGAAVHECEDGLIAVDHMSASLDQAVQPDLILLDMQMPNLDGYATARAIRSLGYTGPIVALTADAMQSDMNNCIEAGCNDYLSKPIDRTELLAKVAELTNRKTET
jgi:CheY-like chemotaxis protein